MIKFTASLEPVAFKRVMANGKRRYNSAEYTEFKNGLGYFALQAMKGREPMTGAIKLHADFYKRKPKKITSRNWGDLDNHLKSVLDALNGIAYLDDAQVVSISGTKNFGEPHINIELEEILNWRKSNEIY